MSVEDAKRAVDIGCTGIVLSNHGGRQLDGSRAAFDQLAEIVDAVGDRIDVIWTAASSAARMCSRRCRSAPRPSASAATISFRWPRRARRASSGRWGCMRTEIERGMKLMGCTSVSELSRDNLRFR